MHLLALVSYTTSIFSNKLDRVKPIKISCFATQGKTTHCMPDSDDPNLRAIRRALPANGWADGASS
jgi:hypothetical protein